MKIRRAPKKSDDVSEFGMSRATAAADCLRNPAIRVARANLKS
jgi:hypothetical protein